MAESVITGDGDVTFDVVVVGSCMRDLFSYMPRLPKPGETVHGNRFEASFGGKGANQCLAASRMGARAALVANLGEDEHGTAYLKRLQEYGFNIEHVTMTDRETTGIASIFVDDSGANCIVIMPGANKLLTADAVDEARNVIVRSSILVCQGEIPMETNLTALRMAKEHKVKTMFNAAPAMVNIPAEIFALSDVFCVNETEAEIILGRGVSTVDDAREAVQLLRNRGCHTAIVTLGDKGVVFLSKNQAECSVVPARAVRAVDTTGAGDAFVGAVAFYLSTRPDLSMLEVVRRSSHVASITVQREGTQDSFPHKRDLPPDLFFPM